MTSAYFDTAMVWINKELAESAPAPLSLPSPIPLTPSLDRPPSGQQRRCVLLSAAHPQASVSRLTCSLSPPPQSCAQKRGAERGVLCAGALSSMYFFDGSQYATAPLTPRRPAVPPRR